MNPSHILIAEDDQSIREGLTDLLISEGYAVSSVENGSDTLAALEKSAFDLLILDIMMPHKSGFEVCRLLRQKKNHIPILFLTAKSEEVDKVLGLELGADDYMTKPFGMRECLARVRALLRRSDWQPDLKENITSNEPFTFAGAYIDTASYTATLPQKTPETLTAREMKLITIFHQQPNRVLSRDELLNLGWGLEYYGTTRTLDQHIAQLRKKCEITPSNPTYIKTVHAVGYRYVTNNS